MRTFLQAKKLYIISGIIVLLLLIILVYFKILSIPIDQFFKRAEIETFIDAENVVLILREDGKKRWQIKAEKIKLSKDKIIVEFINIIEGIYFQDDGNRYYFKANYALYNSVTKNLDIKDEIVITDRKHLKIMLDRIVYTYPDRLESFGKVVMLSKKNYITGDKLVANFNKGELELVGNIRGRLYVE